MVLYDAWAIHGVIFEYERGIRGGVLLMADGTPVTTLTDESILQQRRSEGNMIWQTVERINFEQYAKLTRVSGTNVVEDSSDRPYLCHHLKMEFDSDQVLVFLPKHSANWQNPAQDSQLQITINAHSLERGWKFLKSGGITLDCVVREISFNVHR